MLGSSGAGKSSFLKSLCLHGKQIDISGDGQTTRGTVTYKLERYCKNPCVSIKFKSGNSFVEERLNEIQYRLIEFVCCKRFGMKKRDILLDNTVYLREFLFTLNSPNIVLDSKFCTNQKQIINKLSKVLYLCEELVNDISYEERIIKCYSDVFDFLEKILHTKSNINRVREKKLLQMKYLFNKEKYIKYSNGKEKTVQEYHKWIINNEDILIWQEENLTEDFKRIVNETRGFFDIEEFFFLFKEEELFEQCGQLDRLKHKYDKRFECLFLHEGKFIEDWKSLEKQVLNLSKKSTKTERDESCHQNSLSTNSVEDIRDNINEGTVYDKIAKYYELLYEDIKKELLKKNIDINDEKEIFLDGISYDEELFVARCVRKVENDSLTSIVENIGINDSVSNEYAYLLNKKNIHHIVFYDTCGLDHINRGRGKELYFYNVFNGIRDEIKKTVDAILYIKKLDSGKPVELQEVIPIINRIEPSSPIYCIFSGMDQFIKGKEKYIEQMKWSRKNYENLRDFQDLLFPKAVQDLLENNEIVEELKVPQKVRNKIYQFITSNLGSFSSICQLQDEEQITLNRYTIEKIFTSLLIDEWNSGFISAEKNILDGSDFSENLKKAIAEDLKKMFEIASDKDWKDKHHMTVEANYRRIYRYDKKYDRNNPTLGFNRTQINRWDNLLQKGFNESFLDNGSTYRVMNDAGISQEKTYSLLTKVRESMLLLGMSKWEDMSEDLNNKTKFRVIFEAMYSDSNSPYSINPFVRHDKATKKEKLKEKIEILDDVCDFRKGLTDEITKKFVKYVSEEICAKINRENRRCFELLIENSLEYRESFTKSMVVFNGYFGIGKKNNNDFDEMLQYMNMLSTLVESHDMEQ